MESNACQKLASISSYKCGELICDIKRQTPPFDLSLEARKDLCLGNSRIQKLQYTEKKPQAVA